MADTLTKIPHNLERPKITARDPLHPGYLEFDAAIPDTSTIPLDEMKIYVIIYS